MKKRFRFIVETESDRSAAEVCRAIEEDLRKICKQFIRYEPTWTIVRMDIRPVRDKRVK